MSDLLASVVAYIGDAPPTVTGVLIAMFISVIRVLYDDKETTIVRVLLEALMCGALSLTITHGVLAAGMNMNWAVFAGGCVGYLGPTTVRAQILKWLNKKVN